MAKISPRFPSARAIAATIALAACAAIVTPLSRPVQMRIDGRRMVSDVPPVTTAKGTYVPLRVVADSLGASVQYDPKSGTIALSRGRQTMHLRAGDRHATMDGNAVTLRSAPFSVRGRTMVPLATVASAFKTRVRYDSRHAVVDVITSAAQDAGVQADSP